MTFNLTEARLNSGHSIRSLGEELGIGYQSIRRLEAGEPVRPAAAKKVADFFGVKVTDLMPLEVAR